MVFSSLVFLFGFLPICLALYYASTNPNYRNWLLTGASLLFYAWGEPVWVGLLVFTAMLDWANGRLAEAYRGRWQSKAALIWSVVANLMLLGFFKYAGFILENVNLLLHTSLHVRQYPLPIGISFYTFQSLSYVLDVYRGDVAAQRSPLKFLLFVSLFHQLIAGPIVRYKEIAAEIQDRHYSPGAFSNGVSRFVIGLGKKVCFANQAGKLATLFLSTSSPSSSVLGAWFGITMFAFQIYFDFSGYSDMAIGLGKMFGFTYGENFNYPYVSRSVTEFWRRWHISLSSFFRDYLYIPLGGNRRNAVRNVIVVWFLTGLWHGASWNFVFWGLYFGALILVERTFLLRVLGRLPRAASHIYCLAAVVVGWALFYHTDLDKALQLIRTMLGLAGRPLTDTAAAMYLNQNSLFMLVAAVACTPLATRLEARLRDTMSRRQLPWAYSALLLPLANGAVLAASVALLAGETYNPFLYFRF